MPKQTNNRTDHTILQTVPFDRVENAWFWFIQAQDAKVDGARITAGQALVPRPCEPSDILKVLNNLYRNRLIKWDHCLVLRHYGRKQMAPDARYHKERKAAQLWQEAMARLYPVLARKNIVQIDAEEFSEEGWKQEAHLFQTAQSQQVFDGRV